MVGVDDKLDRVVYSSPERSLSSTTTKQKNLAFVCMLNRICAQPDSYLSSEVW
jgi:hypothetical protein